MLFLLQTIYNKNAEKPYEILPIRKQSITVSVF
jgi:hypothetical protein